MKAVSEETIGHLSMLDIQGTDVFIRQPLDRPAYVALNKVLEAAGGKWDRASKRHIFAEDPSEIIEQIILTGEYFDRKRDFDQFDTPRDVADEMIDLAEIKKGMRCLEPSAGIGMLAVPMHEAGGIVTCIEIDPKRVKVLKTNPMISAVIEADFMKFPPERTSLRFDRVIMNPPFSKRQDIDHILHAFKFLDHGGMLISVASAGVLFREDRKAVEFREVVAEAGGDMRELPPLAFRASGTDVKTALVTMRRK